MIRLLPCLRFTLASPHPINVLVQKLDAKTTPQAPMFYDRHGPWFVGEVTPEGFSLVATVRGRNAFNPVARGEFDETASGSHIHITMMLRPAVLAFSLFWFGFVFLVGGLTIVQILGGSFAPGPSVLILPALLAFGWLLVNGAFWFEARRTRAELIEVMETGAPLPFARRDG